MKTNKIGFVGYDSIIARLDKVEENTQYDFEYDSGDILKSLFEESLMDNRDFSTRMQNIQENSSIKGPNNIFRELRKHLRKDEMNKDQ